MNTKQLADFLNRVNIHLKEKYGTDFVTLIQMGLTAEELLVCILQFNDLYQYIKDNNLKQELFDFLNSSCDKSILMVPETDLSFAKKPSLKTFKKGGILSEEELKQVFASLRRNKDLFDQIYRDKIWLIETNIGKNQALKITDFKLFHLLGFSQPEIKRDFDNIRQILPTLEFEDIASFDSLYEVLMLFIANEEVLIESALAGDLRNSFNFPKIRIKNYAFERLGLIERSSGVVFYDKAKDENPALNLKSDVFLLRDIIRNYKLDFIFNGYRFFEEDDLVKNAETIFINEEGENSHFLTNQEASISERVGSFHPKKFEYVIKTVPEGEQMGYADEVIEFPLEDRQEMANKIIENLPQLDTSKIENLGGHRK